jgi:RNA polymerase sigma factor (sigma-70 family)
LSRQDLGRLFRAHRHELQTYLTERLRDRDAAADLTQETFLRFAEQASGAAVTYDRSYLYRTAHNLSIDHVRRVIRHRTAAAAPEDLAQIAEDVPDPEQVAGARQRLDRLRAAVAALPERTRQVFVLHRIDELTYAETAARLGISESSVQKHLAKALQEILRRMRAGER